MGFSGSWANRKFRLRRICLFAYIVKYTNNINGISDIQPAMQKVKPPLAGAG
jgi:hypothetical protein